MKTLFIRRKKNQPEKPEQPKPEINILALPKSLIAKGVLVRVTEEGAEILEPEGAVLERLGKPVSIVYDPEARRYNEPPRPWVVRSKLEYTYKGQCFGIDGPEAGKINRPGISERRDALGVWRRSRRRRGPGLALFSPPRREGNRPGYRRSATPGRTAL